jgi:hypothetical protein
MTFYELQRPLLPQVVLFEAACMTPSSGSKRIHRVIFAHYYVPHARTHRRTRKVHLDYMMLSILGLLQCGLDGLALWWALLEGHRTVALVLEPIDRHSLGFGGRQAARKLLGQLFALLDVRASVGEKLLHTLCAHVGDVSIVGSGMHICYMFCKQAHYARVCMRIPRV